MCAAALPELPPRTAARRGEPTAPDIRRLPPSDQRSDRPAEDGVGRPGDQARRSAVEAPDRFLLNVPHTVTPAAHRLYRAELDRLSGWLVAQGGAVDPGRPDEFERQGRSAALRQVGALDEAAARVDRGGRERRHVGRRGDPGPAARPTRDSFRL